VFDGDDADDPWPHEPDEPDPEAELAPDPPSVSIPDTSEADVPAELLRVFWGLVLALNVGLLATILGILLVAFRGRWLFGGGLVLLGTTVLATAYVGYRVHEGG
jgi:hypothetical protein